MDNNENTHITDGSVNEQSSIPNTNDEATDGVILSDENAINTESLSDNKKKRKEKKKEPKSAKKRLTEILTTVLEAALIALLLNWFVFSLIEVNQTSMAPTLDNADTVFLTKFSYWFSGPRSGDIIVFEGEKIINGEKTKVNYVKRVIGLPGDLIEIHDGEVYRNGIKLDEPYIMDKTQGVYRCEVPEGKYYVLGDNRPTSLDSRSESIGLVDRNKIIGKVQFKIQPFGKIEKYDHSHSDKK